jgi:hypothetical protein
MHHFEMVPVTAFVRTKDRCGRLPFRIGQITPSVVSIERVAAMYAGLHLCLGSHVGQGTRDRPKSAHIARNSKQHRLRQRINYFLKLIQPSSIRDVAAVRHDRAVISMRSTGNRSTRRKQRLRVKPLVAHDVSVSERLSPYNTVVRIRC